MKPLAVAPQLAAAAYRAADAAPGAGPTAAVADGESTGGAGFGAMLQRAVEGAVQVGQQAETQSMQAIAGGGNITEVVTAVAKAQLTLQTAVNIRDRVVQAYQQIMSMPI